MELWIRSQDRESLLKIEKIFYFNTCPEMESTGRNVILNKEWIGEKDCIELGEYKTKERALEVLDEIQNIIIGKYMVNLDFNASFSKFDDEEEARKTLVAMGVYEMPKE